MPRYRFNEFTLSPQRRVLVREGEEVPLIPRYFDLLLLLIERRHEAVHRREIFERVWTDVSVSDSALSQAVRTLRQTLGDDSREPRFIRTVSRHGYRFVFEDVIEEQEDSAASPAETPTRTTVAIDGPVSHRIAAPRWSGAAMGGAIAGIAAGGVGGLILAAAPGSNAPIAIAPVLAAIGGGCGALGGLGVGAGVGLAESVARSHRILAITVGAALGGGLVGVAMQWLARWGLSALMGLDLDFGGGVEGLVIGGAAGLGFAMAAERTQEAERRDSTWLSAALVTAAICGLAGLVLNFSGHPLVGGTINALAHAAEGSRATLAPLGRVLGEPDFGPVSGAILAFGEAAAFGFGTAYGLLRRT